MIDLNDPRAFQAADPSDFLGVIERFPQQMTEAFDIARSVENLPSIDGITSVAIMGMGGSGISGDVLQTILRPRSQVFVDTLKGYELPAWVGPHTLVFAVSYSGNTEETLQTFELAQKQGVTKSIVIGSGGTLSERARQLDLPLVQIPSGLQPRAALGYLTVPLLILWERLVSVQGDPSAGIANAVDAAIRLVEKRTQEYGRDVPMDQNPAKRLASRLIGKVPIVYGTQGLAEVAAYRWKCQFNECAKVPSYSHVFPELNHNEIVGWNRLSDLTKASIALLILRHRQEHPRIQKRIEVTLPLVEDHVAFVEQVHSEGATDIERLFDLSYFGDFVATYLAIAQGVDPTPVHVIEDLKKQIAGPS